MEKILHYCLVPPIVCFEVNTNDLYEDMKNNKDLYLDFSEYPKTHFLYDETYKSGLES